MLTKARFQKLAIRAIRYIWAYKEVQSKDKGNEEFVINPEMLPKVEQMIGTFKCHWSAFDIYHGVIREIMEEDGINY